MMDKQISGMKGTLLELPSGHYFLQGFDCAVPAAEYAGAPIPCGESLRGLEDDLPARMWLTRFSFASGRLRFEAEVRGKDFEYHLRAETPLVPL